MMFDRIRLGTLMFICLALPFAGCGSSSTVDSIVVTPQTVTFGAVGLTSQLTATATIDHGSHPATTEDVTNLVTWASDGPEVASVNSTGLVTSNGPGLVQVTASMNGFTGVISASSNVTVTTTTTTGPPTSDIASIAIIPGSQTVQSPGETAQFIAIGTTVGGSTEDVTSSVSWTSSSVAVGTVTAKGIATAVGQGSTTISAIATNLDKTVATGTATFAVSTGGTTSAEPISAVTIIPGTQSVAAPGGTAQFIAIATSGVTGLQLDVTSQVKWSSSSVGIGTISSNGLATGVGQGTTAIEAIATNPDGTVVIGSAAFTVAGKTGSPPEPIASISILPTSLSVAAPGQTGQFIAIATSGTTGVQTNVTTSVTWSSSTVGVATIGASTGLATGVSQGTTAITAIATNPDGSVVTGAASFSVAGASTQQITSLSIIPGTQTVPMPLNPLASPTVFYVVIGTNAASGLQQNETNAVSWTSSNTAVATVNNGGGVTLVGQGSTTITAQYTNPAVGTTPLNVVTATATLNVSGVASEPLLSIAILPGSESVGYPGQTSQLTAIGTFSEAPVTQNLTNSTTFPVTWTSSNPGVATVCTAGSPSPCTAATDGLVTAVSQGTTAITAIASNPDGSVVTGAVTFTVTNSGSEQVASLAIIPSAITLSATGQPGQFIAVATLTSGLQEDVTNSPQLAWTTSLPTVATVCTQASGTIPANCPTTPGQAVGVSAGSTNLTAEFTNPVSGSIPANVSTATGTITVNNSPAAEPLLSINVLPGSVTNLDLFSTAQYLAFGAFSTAPTEMDITNGFYHGGFPNATCTAALAAVNTAAIQAGSPAPNAQCSFVPVSWFSLPEPFIFPINSAGAPGALGGLVTADGAGTNEAIYAVAGNPDGTLSYSTTGTFSCPYAPPTYGVDPVTGQVLYNEVLNPGTCNALTVGDGLLSTLTVFNAYPSTSSTGLNQTNWLLTAPSATGTPDVIHCGGATEQALPGGSVCEATYPNGTVVTVTAPAETGVNFGGWSSSCISTNPAVPTAAGPNSCQVVVGGGCTLNPQSETYICTSTANVSVGAIFN
jgi:hypothetical protein